MNENKEIIDCETLINNYDELSTQIITIKSKILSIDDTIHYMNKALSVSNYDSKLLIKEVRKLSRQQFLYDAHLRKISTVLASNNKSTNES